VVGGAQRIGPKDGIRPRGKAWARKESCCAGEGAARPSQISSVSCVLSRSPSAALAQTKRALAVRDTMGFLNWASYTTVAYRHLFRHNPSSGQARSRSLASWIFVDHTVKEETVRDLNLSVERALLFLHINLTAPLYYFSFDGCYLLTSTSSLLLLFFFLPHSHLSSEMMMRFTSVLLTLFLFLLLHQGSSPKATAATHPDIADETCRRIADDDPNVNYTFCTQALRSVSKSKRADLRGLAIISLKLAKANATHAKSRVKALLKEKQLSTYRKSCLQTCRELYSDAASSFRNSVKQIKSGRYADAKVYISSAVDAPGECEDSFQEGDITSPLTKVNYDLFQLAVIALAITSRLG
ncbi:PMEI, partial [Musa troglodytarum]